MNVPPLSHFFWQPAAPTPGSAPWPLMLWFESASTTPQATLSVAPKNPLISPDRPGMFSGPRYPNLSTTIR